MANVKNKFKKGIILQPDAVALDGINGELKYDSADHKFKATANSSAKEIVDNSTAQTLTNKSIDADNNPISNLEVDNLKSGVLDTDLSAVSGSHDTLPSAKAVKDYVDGQIDTVDQASEISYSNVSSGLTASNVQAALDEIDVDIDDLNTLSGVAKNAQDLGTFTGSTIADASTIKVSLQSLETSLETKAASSVVSEIDANVDDLITLSGVAENSSSLGTFTGATIPDSSTVKAALQSLETSLEEIDQNANDLISLSGVAENATTLGTFTGVTIPDSQNIKQAIQALETDHEAHLNDSVDAHDASAISSVASGNLVATDVQAALNELQTDIDTRATSSALTTHTGASTGVHGVTGSVVGTSDSQTLTNKTINTSKIGGGTASATNKTLVSKDTYSNLNALAREEASVYFATDAKKLYVDDGSSLLSIGSGQGGINYIDNPDFEINATGYSAYADAAGVSPVDGTGGSPVTTIARSTSSPLRDTASGLWSKSAVNRQGEGFSYAFTIDTADQAKVLEISYDYTTSTDFVDADMRMFLYDVTNAVLIEPSQRDIQANSGQAKYLGYFQAASNSTSYRAIWHVASTSALAYDFKLDNVKVGPPALSQSGKASACKIYLATANQTVSASTETTVTFNASKFDLSGMATLGSNGITIQESGLYYISANVNYLNLTADERLTFKIKNGSTVLSYMEKTDVLSASSATVSTSTLASLNKGDVITATVDSQADASYTISFGTDASFSFLEASLIRSDASSISASNIGFKAYDAATQSITGGASTVVIFDTKEFDTTNSYSTSTGVFTCPESGVYSISSQVSANIAVTAGQQYRISVFKNGSRFINGYHEVETTATVLVSLKINELLSCVKGDTIDIRVEFPVTGSTFTTDNTSTFSMFKVNSGNLAIAPNETISAKYTTNNGDAVANNTGFIINYEDKSYDTHSAVTTGAGVWKFTAPIAGKYLVQARAMLAVVTGWELSESVFAYIYVNGVNISRKVFYLPTSDTSATNWSIAVDISDTADLVKGDYIDIRILQDSDASINMVSTAVYNTVCIDKIG